MQGPEGLSKMANSPGSGRMIGWTMEHYGNRLLDHSTRQKELNSLRLQQQWRVDQREPGKLHPGPHTAHDRNHLHAIRQGQNGCTSMETVGQVRLHHQIRKSSSG